MRRKQSSDDSTQGTVRAPGEQKKTQSGGANKQERMDTIRTRLPHIYDNITRRLLQFGIFLAITTFIGLIIRYAVQEFDPSVSPLSVSTMRVNNRDIASLSVSKHFLERILEFIEESIAIVASIIPIGFPLCTIFNRHFAKMRAGSDRIEINNDKVLNMIPKYVIIGDAQACQLPNSNRLRPLVRDTVYQLIKAHLKPKLIVEDSYEEARKLGIRIGLIKREHHRLAVIKSVDLLRNITDKRGDIKQSKVRYLLSRMKILSQSTPADKSLLIYLIKCCETMPNENVAYLGYTFTDPEAMRVADCALTFQDCDDEDVKRESQVILKSESMTLTDLYLFIIVCLMESNITQSYALYQISASVSCCLYRFLSITVFESQLISHSQFTLIVIIQQVFAIVAIMTKWLSSLAQTPLRSGSAPEMSHAATDESLAAAVSGGKQTRAVPGGHLHSGGHHHNHHRHPLKVGSDSVWSLNRQTEGRGRRHSIRMQRLDRDSSSELDSGSTYSSSSSPDDRSDANREHNEPPHNGHHRQPEVRSPSRPARSSAVGLDDQQRADQWRRRHHTTARSSCRPKSSESSQHINLSGVDLDKAVINSQLVTSYRQTFRSNSLIDDVTFRLAKLHIAFQLLVMIIIMIFGELLSLHFIKLPNKL